jgi:hypothetical protein
MRPAHKGTLDAASLWEIAVFEIAVGKVRRTDNVNAPM